MPAQVTWEEKRVHGRAALEAVGIPLEFAAQIMLLANESGVAIAIRAGKPFQLYSDLCAPKPPFIKAKTGNWGFAKGVIPENYRLGKIDADRNLLTPPPIPAEVVFTQHKISLSEIMNGLQKIPPEYNLVSLEEGVSPEDYIKKTHRLVVSPASEDSPKNNTVFFSVDLMQGVPPLQIDAEPIRTALFETTFEHPAWWQAEWGDFAEFVNYRYPAEYQESADDVFHPLQIYALQDSQNRIIPVTGDMDLLWITHPTKQGLKQHNIKALPRSANQMINTASLEGSASMLEALMELHTYFAEQKDEILDINEIRDESIPFESFFITNINERFSEFAPHITNLFQHGAENRNPGKPSDLDGRMLHIWKGEVTITESEEDLVDFVLNTPGYLENNIIDIHPQWNMKLWAPVIHRQLLLKQSVGVDVLLKYLPYTETVLSAVKFVSSIFCKPVSPKIAEKSDNATLINLLRCQRLGSYLEKKCFTARTALAVLEDLCKKHSSWVLDKIEKKLCVVTDSETITIKLDSDHISSDSISSAAMAVIIKVAMALDVDKQKIIVRGAKKAYETQFQAAWDAVVSSDAAENTQLVKENFPQLIKKIETAVARIGQCKEANPEKYYKSFIFPQKKIRRLSFHADAKAQHAWLQFFNEKSSDMEPKDKEKFLSAHARIKEIMNDFDKVPEVQSCRV
jgi:hypothetical protein